MAEIIQVVSTPLGHDVIARLDNGNIHYFNATSLDNIQNNINDFESNLTTVTVDQHVINFNKTHTFTFVLARRSNISAGSDKTNPVIVPVNATITRVYAEAGIGPVGSSLIFDINKNGSSIWAANQSNRLTITSGNTAADQINFDVTSLTEGDILTLDVDQIGSITPGKNITIVLKTTI